MSNTIITPYMSLTLPIPGVETGPAYASDNNSSFTILDQHNHTPGSGQQIPPAGLNINANLPIQGNSLTQVGTINFNPYGSPLAGLAPNLGAIYVSGNELYYNDEAGNIVQLTSNGTVNATSSGIVNGTASASFVGGVLVVKSSATSGANILAQSIILTNAGNLTNQLTLEAPTLSSSYAITLPALPSVLSNLTIDTSGNIGTVAAPYQIVVGPGGNYATIGAAITAASSGASIFVLPGVYTENVVVNKALTIIGSGRGTIINGSLELATGSSDSLVQSLKVTMGITIDSGVSEIQLLSFWNAAGQAITDNGSGNYLQGMQE